MKKVVVLLSCVLFVFAINTNAQSLTGVKLNKESYRINDNWTLSYSTTVNYGATSYYKIKCYYKCIGEKFLNETTFIIKNNSYASRGTFTGTIGILRDGNKVYGSSSSIPGYITLKLYKIESNGKETFLNSQKAYFKVNQSVF